MTAEQHPVWDREALLARVRGKEDRLVKLVNMYLSDMPTRLTELEAQIQAADLGEASRSAHTIKGVSANLGVMRLLHESGQLEQAAANKQLDEVRSLLDGVKAAYQQSEVELQAFITKNAQN